ncbi:flagellar export chaperone FliS [Thiohalobacter sp. IOR34]|uniref:flagellar export chaperone FliS n=1 Tax=Thiohalobacter sp. IOR34 TaxID=3057176 RepID=UPI0025B11E5A|nr:flagellar export chaperone FliS [Thiohalobacter sp. IOR34]WJW74581.1 flagellar export chaperone FliS [Thiohalobacter sp. IOR34]
MNPKRNAQGAGAYAQVAVHTNVEGASPHRLVQMLMEGALDRIVAAKGCMQRRQIADKGQQISVAISIVNALHASLDKEAGGEIAANLDQLYDYMERRLLEANVHNDPSILDEVVDLLRQIKTAWDAIADQPDPRASQAAVG